MSDADFFSTEQQINPYYGDEPADILGAVAEHAQLRAIMKRAGINVEHCQVTPDSQDGVYTANWALVRGDTAILARLPDARKAEEDYAETILKSLGKTVVRVPEDWKFSGQGDALACGNFLFCGRGYRSDEAAQKFAADTLGYNRIQLQTVPQLDENGQPVINAASGWADSFFYDIDLALSIITAPTDGKKGLIAYCPEAFTKESQRLLEVFEEVEKIIVSEQEAREALACNLVSTGGTVVMSGHAPQLSSELEKRGFTVVSPDIHELIKGGGFIRCTTLTLD